MLNKRNDVIKLNMFSRFKSRQEPVPSYQDEPEVAMLSLEQESIDPYEFVTSQEERLADTSDTWREIARAAREREEGYIGAVRQGLVDVWLASRSTPLPDDRILERETEKLASNLSVYSLMVTRNISIDGVSMGLKRQVESLFLEIPDHTVNYIIRSKGFPTGRFLARQVWLVQKMEQADIVGDQVLHDLVNTYAQRPDDISELAELYDGGAAEADGRFAELQQLIATDWHRPDSEKSILKNFVSWQQRYPDAYVPDFVGSVSATEAGQRWMTVRNMARFAIIAAGGDPNEPEAVEQTLASTYNRWDEVPDIKVLFDAYVQGKVDNLGTHFAQIAGARDTRNIRNYPTTDQIMRFKNSFGAEYTPDRQSRRKASRAAIKSRSAHLLPTAESIDATAATESVRNPKPRRILMTRTRENTTSFEEMSVEDLITAYKLPEEGGLAEDMRRVVSWLQAHPIGPGSGRIAKDSPNILPRYNGKPVNLWRFAPNQSPHVQVNRSSKYWRVVYGLVKDGVIINDIIDHDTFDKKYK